MVGLLREVQNSIVVHPRGNEGIGIRDTGFGNRDSGFGKRSSGYEVRDSGIVIRETEFGIRYAGLGESAAEAPSNTFRRGIDVNLWKRCHVPLLVPAQDGN